MKILISPAKSLDLDPIINCDKYTVPAFLDKSSELIKGLRKLSTQEISDLMSISENLSLLNYNRYKEFSTPFNISNSKPAIFIFNGDVYDPIDLKSYNKKDFSFLQNSLRILSGLYGILKPLDLIAPYRLEMSTKFRNKSGSNLYQFWGESLSDFINEDIDDNEVIINLASNEYFKAVKLDKLKNKVIKIDFKENKSGQLKTIGIMAKRARGEMVNYIIKNKVTSAKDLQKFNEQNYRFNAELSGPELYTFTR